MQHKVTDVVYVFAPSKNRTQPTFVHLACCYTYRVQICSGPSVSLTAENVCLGNKYFLTSTSTSGPSTSTWHASTSTRKLYLSTDQDIVPVPSTTRLVWTASLRHHCQVESKQVPHEHTVANVYTMVQVTSVIRQHEYYTTVNDVYFTILLEQGVYKFNWTNFQETPAGISRKIQDMFALLRPAM